MFDEESVMIDEHCWPKIDRIGRWIEPRFDGLCRRHGLERIVALCKTRAAATKSSEVERVPCRT